MLDIWRWRPSDKGLAAPGDYTVVYGTTDNSDYLRYVCECGERVTVPLSNAPGISWPAESEYPVFSNVTVHCDCGIAAVLNG